MPAVPLNNSTEEKNGITSSSLDYFSTLNVNDLQIIHDALTNESEQSSKEFFTKERFCDVLSSVLLQKGKSNLEGLFDAVDISREGTISWDQISNHLLLEFYETEDRIKTSQIPQWQNVEMISNPHKSSISCIMQYTSKGIQYCTVSKDGMVCLFDDRYTLKKTYQIHTNQDEIRSRDLWVTDAALIYNKVNLNKIGFATTSKQIWIYDLSSNNNNEFVCQYKIGGFDFIPLCLSYWNNHNNTSQSILSIGDTSGHVYVLFFNTTGINLFDKPLKADDTQDVCYNVKIDDVISGHYPTVDCIFYHGHSAWVRQIQYVPLLDCFMSCSTTSSDSIALAWLGKSRRDVRLSKFEIPMGVNGFDYHEKLNLIATAGIDNHVCLWNPYVVSKPIGVLTGHMQLVVCVKFMRSKAQLISLSKDKVLRVWDINLQICLQRLTGVFPKSFTANSCMLYDQEQASLVISFNHLLSVLKMNTEIRNRTVSHDAAVMDFVYNEQFEQVITVCEGSSVIVWLLNTGQKVKHIPNAHGSAEITTVTIDHSGTRILTAGTDGLTKIWDVNGICHHELVVENGNPCEITQILVIKRMILAFGWSKAICYFPTAQMKSYKVYPVNWKGRMEHQDDILTADFSPPRTLVTASYDGEIVFWNITTQNSIRKITTEVQVRSRSNTLLAPLNKRCATPNSLLKESRAQSRSIKSRRLESRKNSSSLPAVDSQPIVAVTSLGFLKNRNGHDPRTADLYSCHSDGSIRFWNSLTCQKIIEYYCFDFHGAMVSCIDSKTIYLAVGGETGVCKIYDIEDYGVNKSSTLTLDHGNTFGSPYLRSEFQNHVDAITNIRFLYRYDTLLVLTSSCDCSVALHCLDQLIGVFGQKQHWNLNDEILGKVSTNKEAPLTSDRVEHVQKNIENSTVATGECETDAKDDYQTNPIFVTDKLNDGPHFEEISVQVPADVDGFHETWDRTVLGKTYQELRKSKRGRKQPYRLDSVDTKITSDKHTRSYRCLKTNEISETTAVQKPDFVTHPDRYFQYKEDDVGNPIDFELPSLCHENLQLRHDEKSIFPKYILDMEVKMKTAHKCISKPLPVFSRMSDARLMTSRMKENYKKAPQKVNKWRQVTALEVGTDESTTLANL